MYLLYVRLFMVVVLASVQKYNVVKILVILSAVNFCCATSSNKLVIQLLYYIFNREAAKQNYEMENNNHKIIYIFIEIIL